jgi:2-polyprenyl-3-methyl-5-hydroxy-6-metoxy-1,4-benzoquinol methylase
MNNSAVPRSAGEWWQDMFDPDWIQVYAYKNRDTRREANALKHLLGLSQGGKILDVCCGDGRVSLALARLGYQVSGLDCSPSLLAVAAKKASRAGLAVEWLQRDMREINIEGQFDAVVNMFTSFGYFLNEDDNLRSLQSFHHALKPDGKLVLDIENLFFVSRAAQIAGGEPMYRPVSRYRGWVEEITDFDPVEQRVTMSLKLWYPEKGIVKSGKASYRAYSLLEMRSLLKEAGFTVVSVFGDFGLNPYVQESERMILLCVKVKPEAA